MHYRALMTVDNPTLNERYFISSFISGLKPKLQPMIRLLKPRNLNQAFEQALLQEQPLIEMSRSSSFTSRPYQHAALAECAPTRNLTRKMR